ncbi:MAG: hypothetical protein ACLVEJ_21485 [Parabacteroides sp.]
MRKDYEYGGNLWRNKDPAGFLATITYILDVEVVARRGAQVCRSLTTRLIGGDGKLYENDGEGHGLANAPTTIKHQCR